MQGSSTKPIVIGIAGGTGAGKTTFARSIYAQFGGAGWGVPSNEYNLASGPTDKCHITYLSHDDYYKDLSNLPMESRSSTNFDHPSSLDTDLMIEHINELLEGKSVVVPRYDFTRHCRFQEGEADDEGRTSGRLVESNKIILLEGILILSIPELCNLMDLKVFVDAPQDIRVLRRIQRDTVERGRSITEIITQYHSTVKPMHDEFVEPSKSNADLIVHGHNEDDVVSRNKTELALRVICNHLKMEAGIT